MVCEENLLARTLLFSQRLFLTLFLVAFLSWLTDPSKNCFSEEIVVNIGWILLSFIKSWFKRKLHVCQFIKLYRPQNVILFCITTKEKLLLKKELNARGGYFWKCLFPGFIITEKWLKLICLKFLMKTFKYL